MKWLDTIWLNSLCRKEVKRIRTMQNISPLVNAICRNLDYDGDKWELSFDGVEETEFMRHRCGTVLNFEKDGGYWDIRLPRHIPNDTEKEVLALAVDNWGAERLEHVEPEPEPPGMPEPPEGREGGLE